MHDQLNKDPTCLSIYPSWYINYKSPQFRFLHLARSTERQIILFFQQLMIKEHDKSIDVYYFLVIPKSNNTPFFVSPIVLYKLKVAKTVPKIG